MRTTCWELQTCVHAFLSAHTCMQNINKNDVFENGGDYPLTHTHASPTPQELAVLWHLERARGASLRHTHTHTALTSIPSGVGMAPPSRRSIHRLTSETRISSLLRGLDSTNSFHLAIPWSLWYNPHSCRAAKYTKAYSCTWKHTHIWTHTRMDQLTVIIW